MNGGLYDGDEERNSGEEEPKEVSNFRKDLEGLINRYSLEGGSNTPDFILAEYLIDCLEVFDKMTNKRGEWCSGQGEKDVSTGQEAREEVHRRGD